MSHHSSQAGFDEEAQSDLRSCANNANHQAGRSEYPHAKKNYSSTQFRNQAEPLVHKSRASKPSNRSRASKPSRIRIKTE
jgi:hypothetical protein